MNLISEVEHIYANALRIWVKPKTLILTSMCFLWLCHQFTIFFGIANKIRLGQPTGIEWLFAIFAGQSLISIMLISMMLVWLIKNIWTYLKPEDEAQVFKFNARASIKLAFYILSFAFVLIFVGFASNGSIWWVLGVLYITQFIPILGAFNLQAPFFTTLIIAVFTTIHFLPLVLSVTIINIGIIAILFQIPGNFIIIPLTLGYISTVTTFTLIYIMTKN
jgi:hypothetical protein